MHFFTYQYQICIFIRSAFADRHFMVAVYIMGSHCFSRDITPSILCRVQRNPVIRILYGSVLYRIVHNPKHSACVDLQILMNQLPTFCRILIDCLPFMLGILWSCISYRNDRTPMKKSELFAFPIFLFYDPSLREPIFDKLPLSRFLSLLLILKASLPKS